MRTFVVSCLLLVLAVIPVLCSHGCCKTESVRLGEKSKRSVDEVNEELSKRRRDIVEQGEEALPLVLVCVFDEMARDMRDFVPYAGVSVHSMPPDNDFWLGTLAEILTQMKLRGMEVLRTLLAEAPQPGYKERCYFFWLSKWVGGSVRHFEVIVPYGLLASDPVVAAMAFNTIVHIYEQPLTHCVSFLNLCIEDELGWNPDSYEFLWDWVDKVEPAISWGRLAIERRREYASAITDFLIRNDAWLSFYPPEDGAGVVLRTPSEPGAVRVSRDGGFPLNDEQAKRVKEEEEKDLGDLQKWIPEWKATWQRLVETMNEKKKESTGSGKD